MTGGRQSDNPLYAALAKLYGWTPEQVDRMSDDEIVAVLKPTGKATAPSYATIFRASWSARQRCDVCGEVASPTARWCICGGRLRKLTDAEVTEQWQRYQRQKAEKRKAGRRG